jgi:hypothetical protein
LVKTGGDGAVRELADRERWNERYRERDAEAPGAEVHPPSPLVRMATMLPPGGVAVDLAGGDGGGALFLAERGFATTLVDVSDVALERAARLAEHRHLELRTERFDLAGLGLGRVLELLGPPPPDVVTCFHHLQRPLLASVADDLPPGALFLAAIATTTNLERHERPPARFLLEPGELVELVVGDGSQLQVLHRREGWADDRHRAEIVVRRR